MYTAKDGRKFDHEGMGKSYDRTLGGGLKPETAEGPHEGAEDGESAEEAVRAHGPAEETRIEKRDDDSYSVHSRHEDGHKRSSHGHSLEEAHEHSKELHGGEGEEREEENGSEDEEEEGDHGFDRMYDEE